MPELRRFAPADPFALRWAARWHWGWWIRTGCGAGFGAAVLFVCGLLAPAALRFFSPGTAAAIANGSIIVPAALSALTVLASTVGAWVGFVMEREVQRIVLRTELRRRGFPVCMKCGYERGHPGVPRCPECAAHTPG